MPDTLVFNSFGVQESLRPRKTLMRTIFLDIDGVIATSRTYKVWRSMGEPKTFEGVVSLLDPTCVAIVDDLARDAGASIVVSSTWRLSLTRPHPVADLLRAAGLSAPIVGYTPDLQGKCVFASYLDRYSLRGYEINAYIVANNLDVADIVVFDDDMGAGRSPTDSPKRHGARFIPTPETTGISIKHANRARKMFGL